MVISGPPGHMPSGAIVSAGPLNAEVGGTMFSGEQIDHQITPNHSLYLVVRQRPSRFVFGAVRGPHYTMPGQARTE